jgi:hypothetical protein
LVVDDATVESLCGGVIGRANGSTAPVLVPWADAIGMFLR